MPCRIASILKNPYHSIDMTPEQSDYIWKGVVEGFRIVDDTEIESYECKNYESILGEFKPQMDKLVADDIEKGRVSEVDFTPYCVHALGGCLRPMGSSGQSRIVAFRSIKPSTIICLRPPCLSNITL